jgi:predicted small secreted protein
MKRFAWIAAALALGLAACGTVAGSGVSTPSGPAAIPSGPIDLGDWRRASASATLETFQHTINARYGAGLQLSAVTADMRRNEFTCAPPSRGDGRGDPPAQVCRKTVTVSGCTHTWQAHLFDANNDARLARTRSLYDRRCGGDGLLGGPGR